MFAVENQLESSQILAAINENFALKPRNRHESAYLDEILVHLGTLKLYENENVKAAVMKTVPWERMVINSVSKRSQLDTENVAETACGSKDLLLIELLAWFKNSFFKWFNKGYCDKCCKDMDAAGFPSATDSERQFGASRVELYKCSTCDNTCRFPRYNHPFKLLETRKGRCGEWANCFAAILHALQYDVRLVYDRADHVWVEAYSDCQKRWIHCDPCENALDTPLMYELGWKKTVTYVVAVGVHEVQDVTWRYTSKFQEVLKRRADLCRETWLNGILLKVTEILQRNKSDQEKSVYQTRRLGELVELVWTPNQRKEVKEDELQGRKSGSLLWRIQRGEIGSETIQDVNYEFTLSDSVRNITYNCAKDEYVVGTETFKGWESCVNKHSNVFRKEEHDWKMCYLTRCEHSMRDGTISWIVNVTNPSWSSLSVRLTSQTYENASVKLFLICGSDIELSPNVVNIVKRDQLIAHSNKIEIRAILTGGNCWQHSQIFRQSLVSDVDENTLEISIS